MHEIGIGINESKEFVDPVWVKESPNYLEKRIGWNSEFRSRKYWYLKRFYYEWISL